LRPQVRTLIYLDTAASTGTPSFDVLPLGDLYAKSQLLKDRSLYTLELYGSRIFTDYYHRASGIVDDIAVNQHPAPSDQLHKLAVSWNLGLGDLHTFRTWPRRLRILGPWANYRLQSTPASALRQLDVSYRASVHRAQATVDFQRQETTRRLVDMATRTRHRIVHHGKLPYDEYRAEMQKTRIVPSPFGWGEVCFRDFECFLSGATLLKPDMSHLETWPAYYKPSVTYVPYAWDFSDFEEKVIGLLESPAISRRIAQAGQDRYLESLSAAGGEAFATHFAELIEEAIGRANG
jgi:hypothetical protein